MIVADKRVICYQGSVNTRQLHDTPRNYKGIKGRIGTRVCVWTRRCLRYSPVAADGGRRIINEGDGVAKGATEGEDVDVDRVTPTVGAGLLRWVTMMTAGAEDATAMLELELASTELDEATIGALAEGELNATEETVCEGAGDTDEELWRGGNTEGKDGSPTEVEDAGEAELLAVWTEVTREEGVDVASGTETVTKNVSNIVTVSRSAEVVVLPESDPAADDATAGAEGIGVACEDITALDKMEGTNAEGVVVGKLAGEEEIGVGNGRAELGTSRRYGRTCAIRFSMGCSRTTITCSRLPTITSLVLKQAVNVPGSLTKGSAAQVVPTKHGLMRHLPLTH